MKKRLNIIQINGIKGILFIVGASICFLAGFVVFPGMVMKYGWNFLATATGCVPTIKLAQGILLWAIVVVSYFAFKKKGFFVELKSAHELSGEELNAVMNRIRADRRSNIIANSIMKAKELEIEAKTRLDKFEKSNPLNQDKIDSADKTESSNVDEFLS